MEKQEARIKCSGCGSSYKLKVPVTDKPVNFKCKKCGKVLKIKVSLAAKPDQAPAAAAPEEAALPGLETTQLPDSDSFDDRALSAGPAHGPQADSAAGSVDIGDFELPSFDHSFSGVDDAPGTPGGQSTQPEVEHGYAAQLQPAAPSGHTPSSAEFGGRGAKGRLPSSPSMGDSPGSPEMDRRWLVLDEEQVKGPFTDAEVIAMISDGEITAEMSLRMGQRPWIKAAQVSDFREFFTSTSKPAKTRKLVAITLVKTTDAPEKEVDAGPPFYTQFPEIAPYPLGGGNWQPIAIFFGIAFVVSTVLSLEFLIGLPVSIVGWIVLYGYLSSVMTRSMSAPKDPPPDWDFSDVKSMLVDGAQVFVIFLVPCLIPLTICLLFMIAFFLNGMDLFGYIFTALTVLVYLGSLFVVPAGLVAFGVSHSLGVALDPRRWLALIKEGGTAYQMLAVTFVAAGFVCMVDVLLAVFLVDIPLAGFVVAGLLMALILSYVNFIWFHVLGRFAVENRKLTRRVLAAA
ncbi:MAG: DUF4013 domain-containing protein [Desulfomonile tiedjei]|nr:DUF4013 domain-containing protein [Desulfomonile tiedjei]